MKSLLSELSVNSQDENMIGQVWKKVQEQIASATRNKNAASGNNKQEPKRIKQPPHTVATKRKAILNHYASQLKNTTTLNAMSHAFRNASYHRFSSQLPAFPEAAENRQLVRDMFTHAYDSYMYYAFPHGQEINPMSCTPGRFGLVELPALTLLDALDTLLVLGNRTEFARAVERLRILDHDIIFAVDQNVSVFETNIRVLGGLLSAHQLALAYFTHHPRPLYHEIMDKEGNVLLGPVSNATSGTAMWNYDGLLLQLATDIADRLLPAFRTDTGIPYGTVNLLDGVPRGETNIASLAGAGTLSIEFTLLSALTGNPLYASQAKLATRALFFRRHPQTQLLGKHVDTATGQWTETVSGIGSNSDSFYEYLAKHAFLFGNNDTDFWTMFVTTYKGVHDYLKHGDWYSDADMSFGQRGGGILESLAAFFPGLQATLGEIVPAASSLNQFTAVRETVGVLPERFSYGASSVMGNGYYPLRPELLESIYHMHRTTGESGWQWAAHAALHHLHRMTKARCGYAAVVGVRDSTTGVIHPSPKSVHQIDEMPSFFLSETLKYLYLTFDDENFLHVDKDRDWVFTTEAHPVHAVVEKDYVPDVESIQEILKSRLNNKKRETANADRWKDESWTEKTAQSPFQTDIDILEKEVKSFTLQEDLASVSANAAHRMLRSQGRKLRAACQNQLHNPRTLWTRALLGGSVDYTVATDFDASSSPTYDPVTALSMLGQTPTIFPTCPLKLEEAKNTTNDATNDLGMFEVTSHADGFFVRNKASNEHITAHMVYDDVLDENISMVYVELKGGSSAERSLSVLDFQNHVVSCRVDVFSPTDSAVSLLNVPCCPALFGPASPSRLFALGDDVVVESSLLMSDDGDGEGCSELLPLPVDSPLASSEDVCVESTAKVVDRGTCPFFMKAENAKGNDILIVVDKDDSGLFMMSSTKEEAMREDVPLSVLISAGDGDLLDSAVKNIDDARIRVHLERSATTVDKTGKIYSDSTISWPVVGGDENTMHVLVSSGWGIRASREGRDDWQLQLVKHG